MVVGIPVIEVVGGALVVTGGVVVGGWLVVPGDVVIGAVVIGAVVAGAVVVGAVVVAAVVVVAVVIGGVLGGVEAVEDLAVPAQFVPATINARTDIRHTVVLSSLNIVPAPYWLILYGSI